MSQVLKRKGQNVLFRPLYSPNSVKAIQSGALLFMFLLYLFSWALMGMKVCGCGDAVSNNLIKLKCSPPPPFFFFWCLIEERLNQSHGTVPLQSSHQLNRCMKNNEEKWNSASTETW